MTNLRPSLSNSDYILGSLPPSSGRNAIFFSEIPQSGEYHIVATRWSGEGRVNVRNKCLDLNRNGPNKHIAAFVNIYLF